VLSVDHSCIYTDQLLKCEHGFQTLEGTERWFECVMILNTVFIPLYLLLYGIDALSGDIFKGTAVSAQILQH
jgi:hypothetical protein